ncbi:hypothetical protein GCM10020000_22870 [Streptomyces olivoverticillatus]
MKANLARVQDLTDELRRQLKPLGRQAAVARRAAVIQADLRDARLRLLADDLVTLREALRTEIADEAALKARKEAAEAELHAAAQREAALEEQVRELTPRLARAQQTWYELSRLAERVRGTISLADARVTSATAAPAEERRGREPEDLEREAARIREQEAELEAALEAAGRALEDTADHRAELERRLAEEERRLRDAARATADRREQLARLQGKVTAARGRAASAEAEIGRLAAARDEARERAAAAQQEYERQQAEADGADADDAELAARHRQAKDELATAEAGLNAAREAATEAERRRAAITARHDALALGLRRKDGTGALLSAKERLGGLLGPAAELLSVTPGYELQVAAALGAAADGIAVGGLAAAAEALRLLKKEDAGRATLLLTGAPETEVPASTGGLRFAVGLVRAPEELMPALARMLRDVVVVDTLEDAEELIARHPALTAVTGEGDLLGAHFAQGGSSGAPSLLETQAAVDEAAAELTGLDASCTELAGQRRAAEEHRARCAALVEELAARRSAADREKSQAAQALGRLAGQARAAAGEAERAAAAAERAQEALGRAAEEAEELAERLAAAEELSFADGEGEDEPDTSVRDRLAADGANARQTEMEARLQVRTHEERVKALAGRADGLDRAARTEREARARAEQRRARLRHEAEVAGAVAAGARQLLAHVEVSLVRADEERQSAEAAKAERERELAEGRNRARELKGELDKLTDSVHRGEVLGAEKRLRIEQLEAKALEELGVEPAGLVTEYGPDQPVPPSPLGRGRGTAGRPGAPPQPARPLRPGRAGEAPQGGRTRLPAAGQGQPARAGGVRGAGGASQVPLRTARRPQEDAHRPAPGGQGRRQARRRGLHGGVPRHGARVRGRLLPPLPRRRGASGAHEPGRHAGHRRGRGGPPAGQEGQAPLPALRRRALPHRGRPPGGDLQGPPEPLLRHGRGGGGPGRHQSPAADPDHEGAPGELPADRDHSPEKGPWRSPMRSTACPCRATECQR